MYYICIIVIITDQKRPRNGEIHTMFTLSPLTLTCLRTNINFSPASMMGGVWHVP